ncbi:Acyl-coenzyme A thioesterase PaaI [Corynebacterium atrinae]|uniref:hydroxyphenylacetyl-CoA thioesterase PaaI n=1 Tax=Corynebacterium atrinae TaxID=1336740 RepID=UPI0025B53FCC|nr:hydroxyphenylacetyl-CoA thioesterase PaaI [Corynebacterium atrinae]WJY64616.1 Acyl-coenzyme A thioesterase PaaI [Corynebacterium atrinae]
MTPILAPGVATGPQFEHVRTMFETDRASQGIGMIITHLGPGEARGTFTIRPDMCNGHHTAQGGYLFTFADSLFAGACNSHGEVAVAAQVGIHYIAPAFEGDVVEGHAVERRTWGRNGITDVTLTVNGKVITEFRGTSRTIPRR